MDKKSAFVIGSAAAARSGNCSKRYVCPLCRKSFFEFDEEILTEEHVPARALGGKGLVLTCVDCNHDAGAKLQGHQAQKNETERFWSGTLDQTTNIEIFTDLGIMRGEGNLDGQGNVAVTLHHNRMNPTETKLLEKNANKLTYTSYKIGRNYNQSKARIADLRDAYLWIFARFGYTAIAHPWLDWCRETILTGVATQKKWAINLNDSRVMDWQAKAGGPIMCHLVKPEFSVLVCNGASGVLLPTIFNNDPYKELVDEKAELEFGNNTRVEKVPDSMIMGMDFSDIHS